VIKTDSDQLWINIIADDQNEGFDRQLQISLRCMVDSQTDDNFSGSYEITDN